MKQKTIVVSIRFDILQIERMAWLKSKGINPATIIRNGFDNEFKELKKAYNKEQLKETLPF